MAIRKDRKESKQHPPRKIKNRAIFTKKGYTPLEILKSLNNVLHILFLSVRLQIALVLLTVALSVFVKPTFAKQV